MAGGRPIGFTGRAGPGPCAAMILGAKFTKKAPDSMNFVNLAGKRPCFQGAGCVGKHTGTGTAGRFAPLRTGRSGGNPLP